MGKRTSANEEITNMMKNNDWIILNAITYKIHSIEDEKQMRFAMMEQLKYLIDFDSASFYIADAKDSKNLVSPVGIAYSQKDMEEYIHVFKQVDYSEGMMFTGKNIAYRESDLVAEKERVATDYYKLVYDVQGWHYSLHLNISYQEEFLGVMSFFRKKGREDFQYEDIFVLDMLKDHLALRLFHERERSLHQKLTVTEAKEIYGLSEKEELVLRHLLTDQSADEIAEKLNISISTYRKHCNHIYRKLQVSQRIELYERAEL